MSARADTRRRLPAARRRLLILAAARALFARHGYDATTTRMIAASAGVTDAMIYRHFRSKQELLLTLIDDMTTEFAAMANTGSGPAPPPDAPPAVLLTVIGARFADAFETHLDLIVLLLTHRENLAEDHRFVTFIDRAAQHLGGILDPADPARGYLLARGFMGAIASFGLLQRTLGLDAVRTLDVHEYVSALVPLFTGAASHAAGLPDDTAPEVSWPASSL